MVEKINDELSCAVCLDICNGAVETACCNNLLCEDCAVCLKTCPYCRAESMKFSSSKSIRRLISNLPAECECGYTTTRGELSTHVKTCSMIPQTCRLPQCSFRGPRDSFLSHIISDHPSEAISFFVSSPSSLKPADRDCIGKKGNARIGANGKYFCGQRLNGICLCCDGYCGPSDGCNCEACMELDISARALPPGYMVNREGRISKAGPSLWYCGAKVMSGVPGCDGWCGPSNGPQCTACQRLQQQLSSRYSHIIASWRS